MLYNYKIKKVLKIVDGDTIDVEIDLGFDVYVKRRVRFYGIDAPETRTRDLEEKARGKASKAFLSDLIANNTEDILLHSLDIGKYGRVIGEIYIAGKNVNKLLVSEGYAISAEY